MITTKKSVNCILPELKVIVLQRIRSRKVKRLLTECENIYANHIFDKSLVSGTLMKIKFFFSKKKKKVVVVRI